MINDSRHRGRLRPLGGGLRLLAALVLGLFAAGLTGTSADAADGFRFWGYYQWSAKGWVFSTKGAAEVVPRDGAVEGWRYAVSAAYRPPRAAGAFDTLCKGVATVAGKKRVGVVIDPGLPADANGGAPGPAKGYCVVTDAKATGAAILAATGPVAYASQGLLCRIGGYPAKGCDSKPVKNFVDPKDPPVTLQIQPPIGAAPTTPVPAESTPVQGSPSPSQVTDPNGDSSGNRATTILIGALVVIALAGTALVLTRRRRSG